MSLSIAIVSVILSFVAIIYTALSFQQRKKETFQIIAQHLIEQKSAFLEGYLGVCSKKLEENEKSYLIEELASNYCNAFEYACSLYKKKAIDKKLFKDVFMNEIESICLGKGIAGIFDDTIKRVNSNVYEEIWSVGDEFGIASKRN